MIAVEERTLLENGTQLATTARGLVIIDDAGYSEAGEFARTIKTQQKEVKDYFAPMKEAAHKAHAAICAREKEMLAPLMEAEKCLKNAMSSYVMRVREEARRQEEELRRRAQEEADRKLAEAIKAQDSGDTAAAEIALAHAAVADQMAASASVSVAQPTVSGVSTSTAYEIVSIDESQVPVDLNGVVIRPVDTAAVMKLIKMTEGKIQIPGIQYRETVRMAVTSRRT